VWAGMVLIYIYKYIGILNTQASFGVSCTSAAVAVFKLNHNQKRHGKRRTMDLEKTCWYDDSKRV
jgi:hypothetical protein